MSELAIPGQLTPTSLSLREGLEIEEWLEVGQTLKLIESSIQWWVGDWLLYGQDHYGEEMWQALDRADHTLDNWKYVAKAIPPSRRRRDLKFTHHAEVAALPPTQQSAVLERAAAEHLGAGQIRRIVGEIRQQTAEDEYGKAQIVETRLCPTCNGAGRIANIE